MIKMMALGDSIFAGWDGQKQIEDYRRIPEVIAKLNGWYVNNQAISGTGYGNGINDFSAITKQLNFAGYSLALVEYGVNN
ncbi:MAG: GDSL-like Lipase/Acylhydrolase family protein [Bacteriophage sp.]|nr:MAG: GDSL-like Lipase/Acylhydrolase family protein [Bacteriophage sp.]